MSHDSRQRLLFILLPALLIGVGYLLLFGRSAMEQLQRAEQRLADARSKATPRAQLEAEKARLSRLQREQQQLHTEEKTLQAHLDTLLATFASSQRRTEASAALSHLLHTHGLRLLEEMPQPLDPKMPLPVTLQRLVARLKEQTTSTTVQLWQVRFSGRYLDVLAALESFGEGELLAIPLRLTMEEASVTTDQRRWSLLLWL